MITIRVQLLEIAILALVIALRAPSVNGQSSSSSASATLTSDGVAVDQGIAYVLMLVALALTYIIH